MNSTIDNYFNYENEWLKKSCISRLGFGNIDDVDRDEVLEQFNKIKYIISLPNMSSKHMMREYIYINKNVTSVNIGFYTHHQKVGHDVDIPMVSIILPDGQTINLSTINKVDGLNIFKNLCPNITDDTLDAIADVFDNYKKCPSSYMIGDDVRMFKEFRKNNDLETLELIWAINVD